MKHDPLFYQHILKKKVGKFHRDKTKYTKERFTLKELNDKLKDDDKEGGSAK